jgi:hypothetical protein
MLCLAAAFLLIAFFNAFSADPNPPWRIYHTASVAALTATFTIFAWIVLRLWTLNWSSLKWPLLLTGIVILVDLWRIASPLVTISAIDVPEMWKAMNRIAPASPDFRVMTVPDEVVWQAGLTYTHHLNANGYDPLVSDSYQRLLDASHFNPTSPIARLLGVRYVISNKPYEWSGLSGKESLTLKSQDGGWYIYEATNALPRAFVATAFQVMADDEAARQTLTASDGSNLSTIVSQPPDCESSSATNTTLSDTARIVTYEPNSVDIATTSSRPGILVLTDSYDPNWTVTVDSASAALLRVDTALRGVCMPAGEHHVRFDYVPKAFVAGVIISAIGWAAFLLFGLLSLRFRQSYPITPSKNAHDITG